MRGLLGFGTALAVVAAPWYVYHWNDLIQSFTQLGQLYVDPAQSPPRWSLSDFGWYFWNLVNEQALLPFTLAFFVGTVIAIRRCIQLRFSSSSLLPELLAGALVSYLAMTYLPHKDPRYTLPGLVYVAVLGTFWIAQVPNRRLRGALTITLMAVALINFVGMSTGVGGTRRVAVSLPGAHADYMIYPDELTAYESQGWLRGGPQRDGDPRGLMKGLLRMHVNTISFDPGANESDFSLLGFAPWRLSSTSPSRRRQPRRRTRPIWCCTSRGPAIPRRASVWSTATVCTFFGPNYAASMRLLRDQANPRQRYAFVRPGRQPLFWPPASSSASG